MREFIEAFAASNMLTEHDRVGKRPLVRNDVFRFTVECEEGTRTRKFQDKGYKVFLVSLESDEGWRDLFEAVTRWKSDYWSTQIERRAGRVIWGRTLDLSVWRYGGGGSARLTAYLPDSLGGTVTYEGEAAERMFARMQAWSELCAEGSLGEAPKRESQDNPPGA